jgi:hypothetical protein
MSTDPWKSEEGVLDTRLLIRKYCLKMMLRDENWKTLVRIPKPSPSNTPIVNDEEGDNYEWGNVEFLDRNDGSSHGETVWDEWGNPVYSISDQEEDDVEMNDVDNEVSYVESGTNVRSPRRKPAVTTLPGKRKGKRSRSSDIDTILDSDDDLGISL